MRRPKKKNARRELTLGLILTVMSSPIVGIAILIATLVILLSMAMAVRTGLEIFLLVVAVYGALLVTLYLILLRMVRRVRAILQHRRAAREEDQRTAYLLSVRVQQAQKHLQLLEPTTQPAVQPNFTQQREQQQ